MTNGLVKASRPYSPRTFDDIITDYFNPSSWGSSTTSLLNRTNNEVFEHDDHFEVEMDMPGLSRDDITVEVQDKYLHVSGQREYEGENRRGKRQYTQRIMLGRDIDRDAIVAKYENGVLNLTLPKREEVVQKNKRIEIQ